MPTDKDRHSPPALHHDHLEEDLAFARSSGIPHTSDDRERDEWMDDAQEDDD